MADIFLALEDRYLFRKYDEILYMFHHRQLILPLSNPHALHALRSAGRIDREMEVRG
jgi:hypothetical protein